MSKSVFGGAHTHLVEVLTAARKRAGVTQADLGARLGKHQSLISLIESSQRRVDVIEFVALARALEQDPAELFAQVVAALPEDIEI